MLDKHLKHRPFVWNAEKNTLEVKTQALFFFNAHLKKIIDNFCPGFLNYYTTEKGVKTSW